MPQWLGKKVSLKIVEEGNSKDQSSNKWIETKWTIEKVSETKDFFKGK